MAQPETTSFPCGNCGAKLQFDAAAQSMACPFCGHQQAVARTGDIVRDVPIEEGMRLAARGLGAPVTTIQCRGCGATVNVGQGERTTQCAFCGSREVLPLATNEQAIRPAALVPFLVPKDDAARRFSTWLAGLWLRPGNLKKLATVSEMGGVYVPFWTFNASVFSRWNAERGWHYYENETVTETVNGQRVQRTHRVQHTRWEPAHGSRQDAYRDVLVCAGRGLPTDLVDRFSTFDTAGLTPYQPQFLAGWRAEAYAIDLMPGWQTGQTKIAREQEQRCARDVGGDTHRSLSVDNLFSAIEFKHVLLPIWIAAYRYQGKVFRFLVNGQTGEVVGKAPWSVWKITLLVVTILAVVAAIVYAYQAYQNG